MKMLDVRGGRSEFRTDRRAIWLVLVCALVVMPAISIAAERFDGNWTTKLTCPAKGDTDGYTWVFPSVIQGSNLRGEHGTAGQPGYLLIEGKIAGDGNTKLSASGIVYSRQYARGVFAAKGESYSYNVKVHFTEAEGSGTRDQGLGIVGRPCTFEFVKQTTSPAAPAAATQPAPSSN